MRKAGRNAVFDENSFKATVAVVRREIQKEKHRSQYAVEPLFGRRQLTFRRTASAFEFSSITATVVRR